MGIHVETCANEAAAAAMLGASVNYPLRRYPEQVASTLATMKRLNPVFVKDAISQLMIRERFKYLAETSLRDAENLLVAVA